LRGQPPTPEREGRSQNSGHDIGEKDNSIANREKGRKKDLDSERGRLLYLSQQKGKESNLLSEPEKGGGWEIIPLVARIE